MGTSVSRAIMAHIRTFAAAATAFVLTLGLAPALSLAEESVAASSAQVDSVAGPLAGPGYEGDAQSASPNSDLSSSAEGPTLASTLAGTPTSIVSADVALDAADPVIGSFTVDGLTYAVGTDGLTLVAVAPDAVPDGAIAIPASVTYNGTTYDVTAIGPYSFYLSGATDIALPASVASVDCCAFRSSDVARVEVDPDNPNLASFDGALYSADLLSLLLIPEGRAGAVLLPETAEVAEPSKFSHCSLVDAISVGEGGADFASWDGLLYSADGTTLLRVPAGATDITIRDGCTTIAAGALEGCVNLERINAPATVTSISPDVFESVPTVGLPAQMAVQDGATSGVASSLLDQENATADSASQLTAMVALSTTDDDLPEVDPSSIEVYLSEEAGAARWQRVGFNRFSTMEARVPVPAATAQDSSSFAADTFPVYPVRVFANGHDLQLTEVVWDMTNSCEVVRYDRGKVSDSSGPYSDNASYFRANPGTFILDNENLQYQSGSSTLCPSWRLTTGTIGWDVIGFGTSASSTTPYNTGWGTEHRYAIDLYALWEPHAYTISLDAQGGSASPSSIAATYDQNVTLSAPIRTGYRFLGWSTAADGSGTTYQAGIVRNLTADDGVTVTLYAQWEPYEISFDVDSEPGDVDYPGTPKDSVSGDSASADGTIAIEDPKRPGYVFEGWVIPNAGGTEAVDQDLVYQGDDGKWYVDASKLPDYANDDGKVQLTARWTSVISVDVPSSVTFYADLVTQGQESREGAASSAFGQSKVANQSQVDLRIVGLESSAVQTTDSILGADSILKKADAATPSTSAGKLLSLYPSTKQWTADGLKDPDAVGGSKAATAVDFDLDDVLLEKSFKADDFTIPAGDALNMGYRLNLSETGQQLDYDKLSTLQEGQSASIANVSYTFAAEGHPPTATGSTSDGFYIEYQGKVYGPRDIKDSAECIAEFGVNSPCYGLYHSWLVSGMDEEDATEAHGYVRYGDGSIWPVRLIGINQDSKTDGRGRAGLTFQFSEAFEKARFHGTTFYDGWRSSEVRSRLNGTFFEGLPSILQEAGYILEVSKTQQVQPQSGNGAIITTEDKVFLPSFYEVFATSVNAYFTMETSSNSFQYEFYRNIGPGVEAKAGRIQRYNGQPVAWWTRSQRLAGNWRCVGNVGQDGSFSVNANDINYSYGLVPCFCL